MVADPEAVEAVSGILSEVASGGVSVEQPFELVAEGLSARPDPSRPVTIRAYLPAIDAADAERSLQRARTSLGHLQAFGLRPIGELEVRPVHEEDWAHAWKEHFPVLRIGRGWVIRPSWREHAAAPGERVLSLDPGMAFGTGLHPTTRLCLEALEALDEHDGLTGSRVLDVGCGSGILAIGAALLGARAVLGVDPDPIAVEATAQNAARNGLEGRIVARRGSVPPEEAPFDLVLANLIASLLVELAGPLAGAVADDGRLLASGIFADREPEVAAAFADAGLVVRARWAASDWVALALSR